MHDRRFRPGPEVVLVVKSRCRLTPDSVPAYFVESFVRLQPVEYFVAQFPFTYSQDQRSVTVSGLGLANHTMIFDLYSLWKDLICYFSE